jgi:hypothetical protein
MKASKIIPSNLKNTRWEEFTDALLSYVKTFKTNKFSLLKNKYNWEESIITDLPNLKDLLERKGYKLIEADGYTSSLEYHKRRAGSIPIEILWSLSRKCYNSLMKSFWFLGETYSLLYRQTDDVIQYLPVLNYSENENLYNEFIILDQESDIIYYYDLLANPIPDPPIETNLPEAFLDDDVFPTLDYDTSYNGTNHFLLNYQFYVVEDKDVFISYNTAKAFYETVRQVHRIKEVPHYRPEITIYVNNSNTVEETSYVTYDKDSTKTSTIKSLFAPSGNLNLATHVYVGTSSHTVIDNSITNVSQPLGVFTLNQFNVSNQDVYTITLEYKILNEYSKLIDSNSTKINTISEIVLKYESTIILYCTFPTIYFYELMYSSIKINVLLRES